MCSSVSRPENQQTFWNDYRIPQSYPVHYLRLPPFQSNSQATYGQYCISLSAFRGTYSDFEYVLHFLQPISSFLSPSLQFSFIITTMPLVVMCGVPGSGKTKRAREIAQYLTEKHQQKVVIVNEQGLGLVKNLIDAAANQEKMTRGKIKFQVEKNLVDGRIVIADSMNYIKGYRYQMFCIARQVKTTYCVVYCNSDQDKCREFNLKNQNRFSAEMQQDFMKRMEVPQLKNRWDIPLFERRQQQPTPVQEIADVLLFQAKKSKDPVSTKQDEKLSQDYLLELDRLMQEINEGVLVGKVKLINSWSAVQLKKLKKNFTSIAKQKPQTLKVLKQAYMDYLFEADKRK